MQTSSYVITEAAILFESKSNLELDAIICISAPMELRMKRVLERDNTTEKDIQSRIKSQMSQQEKESLSDYVILNNEKNILLSQIIKIHQELLS